MSLRTIRECRLGERIRLKGPSGPDQATVIELVSGVHVVLQRHDGKLVDLREEADHLIWEVHGEPPVIWSPRR